MYRVTGVVRDPLLFEILIGGQNAGVICTFWNAEDHAVQKT